MGNTVGTELRGAWRALWRDRGTTWLAVVTLALGIGANAAIFSVVHGVLLAPLPYPEADRLVQVWNEYPLMGMDQASVSVPDYFDRRELAPAFEEAALYGYESFNLAGDGAPERVIGLRTTHSLFPLLRTTPEVGRVFGADEDVPGRERVVVLSHGLWQRLFASDRDIVGREIRVDGELHEVVGVMPAGFDFPHSEVQLWKPFAPTAEDRSDERRGYESWQMTARLAPGATVAQAQDQVEGIIAANAERLPEVAGFWETSGFNGRVVELKEDRYGELTPVLLLLQGTVLLVLLIACVNVANLLLARLASRTKELAVRSALGAGLPSLARQLLFESLLLAGLGAVGGLVLGIAGVALLTRLGFTAAEAVTRGGLLGALDPQVLVYTAAVALTAGVLAALSPILSLWRTDPSQILKEEGRGSSGSRGAARMRRVLVVSQVAMALVLLAGAGLLVRTLIALQSEDPGFEPRNVLSARVDLPEATYPEDRDLVAFYDQVLEGLRALPGVEAAGAISSAPFSNSSSSGSYSIEGYEVAEGESAPHALIRVVDEDYFETLGIPLRRGRGFTAFDDADQETAVVVDRTLVEKYYPDADPLAGRLSRGGQEGPWFRIVGVVEPVKIRDLDRPVTKETIYLPYRQMPNRSMTFLLRTAGDPEALAEPLRRAVLEVDPDQPVFDVLPLATQVADSLSTRRVSMGLLVAFGLLAALLAAVGIYGVLADAAGRRRREIGTRMAMGAEPRDILGLVVGQGLAMAGVGVLVGLGVALLLGRLVASQLYGVAAWDPPTLLAVAVLLLGVSVLACYRPARTAARIDPMDALRDE